jgi:hypothetical protein
MKYVRISLLTILVLSTAGCGDVSDRIAYFFSSGGSLRHGTSASEDETSDDATLVISSLP